MKFYTRGKNSAVISQTIYDGLKEAGLHKPYRQLTQSELEQRFDLQPLEEKPKSKPKKKVSEPEPKETIKESHSENSKTE